MPRKCSKKIDKKRTIHPYRRDNRIIARSIYSESEDDEDSGANYSDDDDYESSASPEPEPSDAETLSDNESRSVDSDEEDPSYIDDEEWVNGIYLERWSIESNLLPFYAYKKFWVERKRKTRQEILSQKKKPFLRLQTNLLHWWS